MNRKKALFRLIMLLVILFFIYTDSNSIENDKNTNSNKRFFLIIDFAFLNCHLCMHSFTEFIKLINANGLEDSVFGMLVNNREKDEFDIERHLKIVEKQLRGFIIGNDIKFPIILDKNGVFNDLNSNTTTLILFDNINKVIKKYMFPLTKKQIDEIFFK